MIYIFPKNYEYKEKIFGIISYSTVIIHSIWIFILYSILKNINIELIYKINILTLFELPLVIYNYLKTDEDLIYKLFYIVKFVMKSKIYIFKK